MNPLELSLVLPLAAGALTGLRRGAILGFADLFGVAVSLWLAALLFPFAAGYFTAPSGWPDWGVNVVAFLALFVVLQLIYGLALVPWIRRFRRLLTPTFALRWLDMGAGLIPGAIKGLLLVTVVLVILGVWPIFPPARAALAQSNSGKAVLPYVAQLEQPAAQLAAKLGLPVPAGTADTTLPIPSASTTAPAPADEDAMLQMINADRREFGLAPLVQDPKLREIARAYSKKLFAEGQLSHNSGGSPDERLRAAGINASESGENLAYAPTVQMAHDVLMASTAHRANLLSPKFHKAGIGIANAPGIGLVVAQEFTD